MLKLICLAMLILILTSANALAIDGYYILEGKGKIHLRGDAVGFGYPYPGWSEADLARDVSKLRDQSGYYVLDAYGGLHPYGSALSRGNPYWPGHDYARAMDVTASGRGYCILDLYGGLHAYGDAVNRGNPYWPGNDLARDIAVTKSGNGYYILDAWGGVNVFGDAVQYGNPYWPGNDLARDLAVTKSGNGYYILDALGGIHSYGDAGYFGAPTFNGNKARGLVAWDNPPAGTNPTPPWGDNFGTYYPPNTGGWTWEWDTRPAANTATTAERNLGYDADSWLDNNNNASYALNVTMPNDAVFWWNGHGNAGLATFYNGQYTTEIWAKDILDVSDLNDLKFAAFWGCDTANTDTWSGVELGNILANSAAKGVDSSMGFSNSILIRSSDTYANIFWQYIQIGYSVYNAAKEARDRVLYDFGFYDGYDSAVFWGPYDPKDVTLYPAANGRN